MKVYCNNYSTAPCRLFRHPVVFPQRPYFFFGALSFSKSPLVSSGFYQHYFELEVAESVQIEANRGAIFVHHVVIRIGTSLPSWIYVTDFGTRVRLR